MFMSVLERCVHQEHDEGAHVLFKEQWERCKSCAYDPENNKRCCNYSPTAYYTLENEKNLISSIVETVNEVRV
jgi:hypothetical protein